MSVARSQDSFADALFDPALPVGGMTTWNGSDPVQRFNVYRNNVIVSLVEALRARFPVTEQLVGAEFFGEMARRYCRSSPPRSPLMSQYGADFPRFVTTYDPARDVPYLADVARLESARIEAYHAADARSLAPADFEAIDPEALVDTVVTLHPSARWIRSPYAIFSLWAAHQGALDIATVDPDVPEDALVLRPAADVLVTALPCGTAAVLDRLKSGERLGDALSAPTGAADFDPVLAFRLITTSGAASAVHLPGEHQ